MIGSFGPSAIFGSVNAPALVACIRSLADKVRRLDFTRAPAELPSLTAAAGSCFRGFDQVLERPAFIARTETHASERAVTNTIEVDIRSRELRL